VTSEPRCSPGALPASEQARRYSCTCDSNRMAWQCTPVQTTSAVNPAMYPFISRAHSVSRQAQPSMLMLSHRHQLTNSVHQLLAPYNLGNAAAAAAAGIPSNRHLQGYHNDLLCPALRHTSVLPQQASRTTRQATCAAINTHITMQALDLTPVARTAGASSQDRTCARAPFYAVGGPQHAHVERMAPCSRSDSLPVKDWSFCHRHSDACNDAAAGGSQS
jgi:hypothetical protein